MSLLPTPSQTVGPFFSIGLPWPAGAFVVSASEPGAFLISGTVFDGEGAPIADAVVETWQADAHGAFGEHEGFRGFARVPTGDDGTFAIRTVKPAPVPGPRGVPQAPHLDVSLFARGLLHRVVTRIYFADEEAANAADPVLAAVPAERRATLLARPTADGYHFDLHLQGPDETVFFDV
ncbi:MAG: protocatechuate 3,4-dioxygenase, alpha subunit [Baekduia sp.]|nr:protocatechuate 3,4-dioxygenase, alpha subunit [Baekduia sp.]